MGIEWEDKHEYFVTVRMRCSHMIYYWQSFKYHYFYRQSKKIKNVNFVYSSYFFIIRNEKCI